MYFLNIDTIKDNIFLGLLKLDYYCICFLSLLFE